MKHYINIKVIFSTIICLAVATVCYGAKVTLRYSIEDFNISEEAGYIIVRSLSDNAMLQPAGMPDMPRIPVDIEIPCDMEFESLKTSCEEVVVRTDVTMAAVPYPMTADNIIANTTSLRTVSAVDNVYPAKPAVYCSTSTRSDVRKVHLLVSPFSYDPKNRTLVFKESITVTVECKKEDSLKKRAYAQSTQDINGFNKLRSILSYNLDKTNGGVDLDYIIVTQDSLADAWRPLVEWKRRKGLNADIVPLSKIYEAFGYERTPQLQIKRCLKVLKVNCNLKYVLLGGDGRIVPFQGCRGRDIINNDKETSNYLNKDIPADYFYTSFADFTWDSNNDGIVGDYSDYPVYSSDLILSRIPLHNSRDIGIIVEKLVSYENGTSLTGGMSKMLLAGYTIVPEITYDDTEEYLKYMKQNIIDKNWSGYSDIFCNKRSTLQDYQIFNKESFKEVLSKGYSMAEINCHGQFNEWSFADRINRTLDQFTFEVSDAMLLNAPSLILITSTSCHTNDFTRIPSLLNKIVGDKPDLAAYAPCLAGCFLRNEKSGVIGYLGNTKEGLVYSRPGQIGGGMYFDSMFYRYFLTNKFKDRRPSRCLAELKDWQSQYIDTSDSLSDIRWLLYTINYSGDPETELFLDSPLVFDKISIQQYGANKNIIMMNNIPADASVRIGIRNNKGVFEFKDSYLERPIKPLQNERYVTAYDSNMAISVNKQGYVPFYTTYTKGAYFNDNCLFFQNGSFTEDMVIDAPLTKMGKAVNDKEEEGNAVFVNTEIQILGNSVSFECGSVLKGRTKLSKIKY